MSKKLFLCPLLGIMLSGCSATPAGIVEKRDIIVYIPPNELFHCPKTEFDFDIDSLDEDNVAELILKRGSDLDICRINMKSIERKLMDAKKRFESK